MSYLRLAGALVFICGISLSGAQAQDDVTGAQLFMAPGAVGVSCSSKDGQVDCYCTGGCKRTQHDCSCTGFQQSTVSNEMLMELMKRQ